MSNPAIFWLPSLALAAALLVAGCASTPMARQRPENPAAQAQVQRRLQEIFDAAEKKDFARLDSYHLYGPKFTKFAPEAPGRLDADAARQSEHNGLGPIADLKMQAEDLKIDVFNDVAIATFLFNYSFKAGADMFKKQALGTLVFVNDRGAWKITHEHFTAVKSN